MCYLSFDQKIVDNQVAGGIKNDADDIDDTENADHDDDHGDDVTLHYWLRGSIGF